MSLTGEIQSLFKDKEQTQAVFPVTKTKAVSDDNGVGLNVLLDNIDESISSLNYLVPSYASQHTAPTDLLNVYLNGDYSQDCMQPSQIATEDASTLTNSPLTSGAFYAVRTVEYYNVGHVCVRLYETYPNNGRIWSNMYDKNMQAWRGWESSQSNEGSVSSLSDLGITATAAELNFVDGVTSNIQTQLNGKAGSSHGTHVTYGTSATALGTSSAGSASSVSRSDHVHALPALTSCTGTLTVEKGGTGATTAAAARTNLGFTVTKIIDGDLSGTNQLSASTGYSAGYRFYIVFVSVVNNTWDPDPVCTVVIPRGELGTAYKQKLYMIADASNAKIYSVWYSGNALYIQGAGYQGNGGGDLCRVYGVM